MELVERMLSEQHPFDFGKHLGMGGCLQKTLSPCPSVFGSALQVEVV